MDSQKKETSKKSTNSICSMIPFCYRKSSIISISFRSIDLVMDQYKLKIVPDGSSSKKTPIFSQLSEITIVRKNNLKL